MAISHFIVPSANKRDVRTIEDIQTDIRNKKRQKLSNADASTSITLNQDDVKT